MDKGILHPDVQAFINKHLTDDVRDLALAGNPFPDIPFPDILHQIASKSKAKYKLPTWFSAAGILYPAKLSVEQSSSEETAAFKASLVAGKTLIDATGGFGVDSYFFSRRMHGVIYCESQDPLASVAAHNFRQLDAGNITCVCEDSTKFLQSFAGADWIYLDPARRHQAKGKVFRLADCTPDVAANLGLYLSKAPNILIKTSPMLDISSGLQQLKHVRQVYVVAVGNEVKEMLWRLERGFSGDPTVSAVNLPDTDPFSFTFGQASHAAYAPPGKYLYEPNAAIMKSGGFHLIGEKFGLAKLSRHAHLYTSDGLSAGFPGRTFRILDHFLYKKDLMESLRGTKANVTARHFPETVEAIRKKWKIADGGDTYLFFTTDAQDRKIALICSKI